MDKVVAVILTYNRQDLLSRCLDAIYAQTRACDCVIVIDNASNDGTQEMLLEADYSGLKVYTLSRNIGAAGGFNAGFRLAYQAGADHVWMMDDDVIPEPDALQRLLEANALLAEKGIARAFLLSAAYTESGLITNTPTSSRRKNAIGYSEWPAMVQYGMMPVERATFVSILVPRYILEKYGLPIASMFIWGEDTEFTLRITRDSPGFVVGASKVLHLRQMGGRPSVISESDPVRLRFHRYLIRNNVFIARRYRSPRRTLALISFNARVLFKLARMRRFRKLAIVVRGIIEGMTFFPSIEEVDSPIENLSAAVSLVKSTGADRVYPMVRAAT